MNASADEWPRVLIDMCEVNLPGVGEIWNAASALSLVAAGAVPLFSSTYSDEEMDLINALIMLNGVVSCLSHSTGLRVFGQADALSINIGAVMYMKAIAVAQSPWLFMAPVR